MDLSLKFESRAPRFQARPESAQGIESEANRQDDGRKCYRQDDQQRQTEDNLNLPRDQYAMGQRLGHGDLDSPLKRRAAINPMGGGLPKPRALPGRKNGRLGRMRLQQDRSLGIVVEISEELVVFPNRVEPLRQSLIFAADDVRDSEREDPLCRGQKLVGAFKKSFEQRPFPYGQLDRLAVGVNAAGAKSIPNAPWRTMGFGLLLKRRANEPIRA